MKIRILGLILAMMLLVGCAGPTPISEVQVVEVVATATPESISIPELTPASISAVACTDEDQLAFLNRFLDLGMPDILDDTNLLWLTLAPGYSFGLGIAEDSTPIVIHLFELSFATAEAGEMAGKLQLRCNLPIDSLEEFIEIAGTDVVFNEPQEDVVKTIDGYTYIGIWDGSTLSIGIAKK